MLDDFLIPSRDQLAVALADDGAAWGPGPFATQAHDLLREHSAAVTCVVARYDQLAVEVATRPERFVATHGEPHRANTIVTANGVSLIDWDTALLAPPERDLWALIEENSRIAQEYTDRTGVDIDDEAAELYRLWWDLCEISLYVAQFRAPHADSEDSRVAWDALQKHLDPRRWDL